MLLPLSAGAGAERAPHPHPLPVQVPDLHRLHRPPALPPLLHVRRRGCVLPRLTHPQHCNRDASGVILFGDNDPLHFGNLHNGMVTLFRVSTLDDWTDVAYIQIYGAAPTRGGARRRSR